MTEVTCPKCFGSGALELERTHLGIPVTTPCTCLLAKDLIRNLNRGWTGLSTAPKIPTSPLKDYTGDFLYLTASDETFRTHLRHVALRMGPWWGFKVVSDSDLMVAWLSNASLVGKEILDPDAASVSSEKATLVDLVEPPDLLIIRMGVKAARNSAMSEVFLEAIQHRRHIEKPLWVVDQPTRRLDPGHMCFSDEVILSLRDWPRLTLGEEAPPGIQVDMMGTVTTATPPQGISLGSTTTQSATRRVELPTPREKPRKYQNKGDR